MITGESIYEYLKAVVGLEYDDTAILPFCASAAAELNRRLKTKDMSQKVRLVSAAAGLALSRYLLVKGSAESDITSFEVGDTTVSFSSGASLAESAEMIRRSALAEISDLLTDAEFIFDTV